MPVNIYGIDVDKHLIDAAIYKNINLHFSVYNSNLIPFPDSYFDVIVSSQVIEHIANPLNSLKELH